MGFRNSGTARRNECYSAGRKASYLKLGFAKEESDGSVKYKKDSFRLVTPKKGDFSNIEMWWREDRRHFSFPLAVHELQNLYHGYDQSSSGKSLKSIT